MEEIKNTGLLILTPFEIKKDELQKLADDYRSLVVTEGTFKAADLARKQLKGKRTEIQRIVDDRKGTRLKWKRDEDDKDEKLANEIIGVISPVEKRLETECNAITEKQKKEAAERIKKEEERKRGIKNRIQSLENNLSGIRNTSDIKVLNELSDEISMERDSFEEFNAEGNVVIETLVQAIANRKIVIEGEIAAKDAQEKEFYRRRDYMIDQLGFGFDGKKFTHAYLGEVLQGETETMAPERFESYKTSCLSDIEECQKATLTVDQQNEKEESVINRIKEDLTPLGVAKNNGTPLSNNVWSDRPSNASTHTIPGNITNKIPAVNSPAIPPDFNVFYLGNYAFGITKNVPLEKVMAIREAIEKILS